MHASPQYVDGHLLRAVDAGEDLVVGRLDALQPLHVGADEAKNLRRDRSLRVDALMFVHGREGAQAARLDDVAESVGLGRTDQAAQPDETFLRGLPLGELGGEFVRIAIDDGGDATGGVARVVDEPRVDEERWLAYRTRQHPGARVEDIATLGGIERVTVC